MRRRRRYGISRKDTDRRAVPTRGLPPEKRIWRQAHDALHRVALQRLQRVRLFAVKRAFYLHAWRRGGDSGLGYWTVKHVRGGETAAHHSQPVRIRQQWDGQYPWGGNAGVRRGARADYVTWATRTLLKGVLYDEDRRPVLGSRARRDI